MDKEFQPLLKTHTSVVQFAGEASAVQSNEQEGDLIHKRKRRVKRKKKQEDSIALASFDIPGVTKIIISPMAQKAIECSVGADVTVQNPWKYVPKETFEDNLEQQEGESTFSSIKKQLLTYPRPELLLGYIPDDSREYDEFYICLTAPAEETVSEIIASMRKQQEEKLYNSIFKASRPWKTQGSETEVEMLIIKNNRALFEVEIESQYPVISTRCLFRLRTVQDARDGYSELIAGRSIYVNVLRKRIDACIQVTPSANSDEAQTVCTYPKNAWTQYEYEYEPIDNSNKAFEDNLNLFLTENTNHIDDMIYVNSYINFYKDDYITLVKDAKFTRKFDVAHIQECISFVDIQLCKDKVISSVTWHSLRIGTLAIAYRDYTPSSCKKYKLKDDEVTKTMYEVVPVLLWNYTDSLHAQLFLETPREITVISFCPLDENMLIGGCVNGQVIIWDIKNKVDSKTETILTFNQPKYRVLMRSIMKWMKSTKDLKIIGFTAISDLAYSHRSPITAIRWISDVLDTEYKTNLQFMTASEDGTVLTWDLLAQPVIDLDTQKGKLRRLRQRPNTLMPDVSPYRGLNKNLKPVFESHILAPGTNRNLLLSALDIRTILSTCDESTLNSDSKYDIPESIYYKPVLPKPAHYLVNQFVAGTSEGDFLVASLKRSYSDTEEIVIKETCKIENFSKFHDGPVVSLSKSEAFDDIVLTVGGKVFAIWKTDFMGKPLMWRRSKYRYTHGVWDSHRPSVIRMTREDGYIEIWNLRIRSDRYQELIPISAGALHGTFTFSLTMKQNVMAISDYNGSLRLFNVSHPLTRSIEEDNHTTYKIFTREVDKKISFLKWQESWKAKNAEWIRLKKEEERKLQSGRESEIKRKKFQLAEEEKRREREKITVKYLSDEHDGKKFKELTEHKWRIKEQKRLSKVLLNKKALDIDLLEKQQLPLTKVMMEENQKKKKQEQRLSDANKIFSNTVTMLFPEAVEEKPLPALDPYRREDFTETTAVHFEGYLKTVEQCQKLVASHKYVYDFNWHTFMGQGKERRKMLDGYYSRQNHRERRKKEKLVQKSPQA